MEFIGPISERKADDNNSGLPRPFKLLHENWFLLVAGCERCRIIFLNACVFPVLNARLLHFSIQGHKLFLRKVMFDPNIRFEANRFRGSVLILV